MDASFKYDYQSSARFRLNGNYEPFMRPCGQCQGCRLAKSREWAIRCTHEASLWRHNIFITLTYAPEYVPYDMSLDYRDFQLFMKRYRERFPGVDPDENGDHKIRFYMCGEYGETYGRPHFHAIIFNHDFSDKRLYKTINGNPIYTSADLSELWPFGFCSIGSVTYESTAYVARYVMKKVTGPAAADHYAHLIPDTGEVVFRTPEFTKMSLKPGIALGWWKKFHKDVYTKDAVVLRGGVKMRPPRYYDKKFTLSDPYEMDYIKHLRFTNGQKYAANNTRERLRVRERLLQLRLLQLPRNLDKDMTQC